MSWSGGREVHGGFIKWPVQHTQLRNRKGWRGPEAHSDKLYCGQGVLTKVTKTVDPVRIYPGISKILIVLGATVYTTLISMFTHPLTVWAFGRPITGDIALDLVVECCLQKVKISYMRPSFMFRFNAICYLHVGMQGLWWVMSLCSSEWPFSRCFEIPDSSISLFRRFIVIIKRFHIPRV